MDKPGLPTWELDKFNALTVLGPFEGIDDPEDSLMVALTRREFGIVLWAVQCLARVIPETRDYGLGLYQKLAELTTAQGFLDIPPEQRRRLNKYLGIEEDLDDDE